MLVLGVAAKTGPVATLDLRTDQHIAAHDRTSALLLPASLWAITPTVEEILRLAAPSDLAVLRYTHEDIEIGGQVADPAAFDPSRTSSSHFAFGRGPHFCVGASLARTGLRIAFTALFTRFPALRLGAEIQDLPVRTDRLTGGLAELPVTW
jgi:pentalenolactone synthase